MSKNQQVKVFSAPVCPYCETLKKFLKEQDINFEEVDVSQDKEARKEMVEKSGQMGVPVAEINGQIVVGFNKQKIKKLLKI